MQRPKLLPSKIVTATTFVALLCLIASACGDEASTGPHRAGVELSGNIPPGRSSAVPFNKVFVAWSERYASSPIQMQLFALDTRQERQFVDLFVGENVLNFARANPGRMYIDGDEPDQYCISPYDYAGTYHEFVAAVRSADPTARVSPAGFAEPNYHCCPEGDLTCYAHMHSVSYADQFYNAYIERYGVAPPVNEWRLHDFGLGFGTGNIDGWWDEVDRMAAWSVAHGANMVLASWGFMGWRESTPEYLEHMKQAMGRMMNDPRINAAVYWSYEQWLGNPHYLVNADGTLTPEGQTYVNPLTDIPATPKITGSANGIARLKWNNTTAAWPAEVEFWVQPSGSNSFAYSHTVRAAVPGAVQTAPVAFRIGDTVKARVRYYNLYGQGTWSSFSDAVALADSEAEQQPVFRKRPFCFLKFC